MTASPPCVLHEDDDLLVVAKPAGWSTHAPSPYAGEGVYDWLRHREPRWAKLALVQRLDKDTSGVLLLAKSRQASRSLTEQLALRHASKRYVLVTDRAPTKQAWTVESSIVRAGMRYHSATDGDGQSATTRFEVLRRQNERTWVVARPLSGRTHQIRVHAADSGVPILGDTLYGGSPFRRVCLHAEEITVRHPASGEPVTFREPADFEADPAGVLRKSFIETTETDCYRILHGASDGEPGWRVDRLGAFLLSQSEAPLSDMRRARLEAMLVHWNLRGVYHKQLDRRVRESAVEHSSPRHVLGDEADERFDVRENGTVYELSFAEGYSVGLFLDQRDNRRRLLAGHVGAGFPLALPGTEVLNVFAYTCSFSVCAALAGARTTSLDLSKKYLAWGARNFELNGIASTDHDFIFGDAFDWLRRLAKKGRRFAGILLDPPTFSQSKQSGVFRAEADYGKLVTAALPLLASDGVLFTSTNAAQLAPESFLDVVASAIDESGRRVQRRHYAPQPPDFPVSSREPAYLKTCWWQVG
jgi:23S rRNA (cytosine1962-C5)-methyltransferase